MIIASVALDVPLPQLFDYRLEEAGPSDLGRRVLAPFGNRRLVGILVAFPTHSPMAPEQLKTATLLAPPWPVLDGEAQRLAQFAAQYYQYPLGAALVTTLPPALRRPGLPRPPAIPSWQATDAGRAAWAGLSPRAHRQLDLAQRLQTGAAVCPADAGERAVLRDWASRGWVVAASPTDAQAHPMPATPPPLTPEQRAVVERMGAAGAGFAAWLLHGVTGSGKTEVYLQLMEPLLAAGRQVLVLIPEIHLTPQMEERFRQRFPRHAQVCLHSNLAEGARLQHWQACRDGQARLVLGTRLAVFAPLPRLGLIIVDEEHDTSYKQMEGLRYSARDVAVWRARDRGIPVVLGSATPSLESWRNAQAGRYGLLTLAQRATGARLPAIELVDTRTNRPKQGLTRPLVEALTRNLEAGAQSLVFINRRGYAPTLLCNACGWVAPCPRCSAHLVLHRQGNGYRLHCHHCGLRARPVESCPDCGSLDLRPAGQGTQRVEETLAQLFPQARLLRVDRDTTRAKGRFADMRDAVADGRVDILVGTQILAKGHDFPRLTLVGVVGADQALHSPDFRATERLFAQLMQVAGRAGRASEPGRVLIQTAYPSHPLYQTLIRHDYPAFAAQTLMERREAEFPPFSHQALLRADGTDALAVQAFLMAARDAGLPLADGIQLYDPAPAPLQRLEHRERMQLLVQSGSRRRLQAFLAAWLDALRALPARGIGWSLDVDPVDL